MLSVVCLLAVCEVLAPSAPGTSEQECGDLAVDHILQNPICKLRKLSHTVHHMAQLIFLRELLYLKNQKHLLNSQISFFSLSTVMVSMTTLRRSILHHKCKWFLLKNSMQNFRRKKERERFILIGKLCADFHNSVWDWVGHK